MGGYVGSMEYLIRRTKAEMAEPDEQIKVVATGGLARMIADHPDTIDLVDSEQIEQVKDKVREINPVCPITESANGNIDRSFYDMDLMLYKWAECEDTTNSSKNKPKTFSMDFTGEIQKEKLEAFLAKIEPDVFRVKGFFKVEKEGWEKVDVVGKKRDYAPYEPQPKSQLVFISKIGIALIREIAAAWEECVGLPMKLNN